MLSGHRVSEDLECQQVGSLKHWRLVFDKVANKRESETPYVGEK